MHMWGVVWTRRDNMHFDGKHKSAMAKWGYRYLQFSCRSFGYAYSLAPSRLIHGLVDLRENKLLKNTQTTTITFLSEYRRSERPLQTWCFIDISGGIMFIYLTQVEDIYILTTQFMTRTTHPPGTHYDYTTFWSRVTIAPTGFAMALQHSQIKEQKTGVLEPKTSCEQCQAKLSFCTRPVIPPPPTPFSFLGSWAAWATTTNLFFP